MTDSPLSTLEQDVRQCTLAACHRVRLYKRIVHPNSPRFLDRPCNELVIESGESCPVGPPYNDYLMTFRQRLRTCLQDKGYDGFAIYLQRLCTDEFTWRDFCRYHADRL
ncbi:MAG: hypothetical protein OEN01_09115 [Candidatus Krumholzibacteria bacterium]|nr:hypothetical protein [Candidatus Krumholzibacteria bacterium]